MYDFMCHKCGKGYECFLHRSDEQPTCKHCGQASQQEKVPFLANTKRANIGDECDIWQENGFKTPQHFRSKAERARALAAAGMVEAIRHVDGDRHVKSSLSITKEGLDAAKAMLERIGGVITDKTDEDIMRAAEELVDQGKVVIDSGLRGFSGRNIGLRIGDTINRTVDKEAFRQLVRDAGNE